MALLGLFSKRDKHKTPSSGTSVADSAEDYVLPDSTVPALPNNVYATSEASSSKFHLGFHRKRSTPAVEVTDTNLLRPPTTPYIPSTKSETDVDGIRPPPSKSSLLSAYSDPHNALSTRSLPGQRTEARSGPANVGVVEPRKSSDLRRSIDALNVPDIPPVPKKPGGLFAWAHRERKKSKPSDPLTDSNLEVNSESFNLKSFRHIRPESPSADSTLASPVLLPPVRPRPRNDSVASDSSQRISVAAFREMAARRSAAGSPTTSTTAPPILLRPPSRVDSLENASFRSPAPSFQRSPASAQRSSNLAVTGDSTSSESEDSGDESGSEESSTMRPKRKGTITQESSAKASSELGHRMRSPRVTPSRVTKSTLGHSEQSDSGQSSQPPKPNAAAKRASIRVTQQPLKSAPSPNAVSDRARGKLRARSSDSDDDSSSSSEDSDDAPLASLLPPVRPGSSASNATSGSRSRIPPKPLIDISQMSTPPLPSASEKVNSPLKEPPKGAQSPAPPAAPAKEIVSPSGVKEKEEKNETRPTHSGKPSLSDRLARIAQTAAAKSVETLATSAPLERRSLDSRPLLSEESPRGRVSQPVRSQTAPLNSVERASPSPSPAAARMKPKGRTLSSSSPNAAAAYDLTDPTPIVPTPIRERSPPPAFSVTSRPPSQLSLNSNPRLSMSPTVRMVGSSGSSSSPSTPTTPFTPSSPDIPASSRPYHVPPIPPAHVSPPTPPDKSTSPTPSSPPATSSSSSTSRKRSSTLIPHNGIPPSGAFTGSGLLASAAANAPETKTSNKTSAPVAALRTARQRSSTLLPQMEIAPASRRTTDRESMVSSASSGPSPPSTSSAQSRAPPPSHRFPQRSRNPFDNSGAASQSKSMPSPSSGVPPPKPFAVSERGNSPASSTGDSSSGRTPLTPADGSDYGYPDSRSAPSAMGAKKGHRRGPSVTFDDEPDNRGRPPAKSGETNEERRNERRRSEAKAAIELGHVVNGRIQLEPDDDDDRPLNNMGPRMSMANPMMNFTPPSPMNWQGQPNAAMLNPQQFMFPQGNTDPRFLAAHQQAMMVAKQAYQMAVAQQAMAAANEEWERGSNTSAFGNMGLGMGMGGMGMNPMGQMGMPMLPGGYGMNWNNSGAMMFPSSTSMYGGSVAGSDVGWGTRSEYGGPSRASRTSAMLAPRQAPAMNSARSEYGGQSSTPSNSRQNQRPRTKTSPSDMPLPSQHTRVRQAPPPSSWKASQGGK
ncbi:hypothetical protein PHLCEN_2v2454 [Hermanssonia centrifuga]|uniref:Uncharacterized protein n=1 Tax=Hermanssonia centrifuga TaxID=98765 RepID=A0A2R6RLV8_9APHY|nr:hypothetical protein PHLCEN_2v2454 [Hermanssonia centrifuga]